MYGSLGIHRKMLRDEPRTEAFRKALFASVKEGDVVLDFGAGSGILSIFAAQAGAARVYAVERTEIAALAGHLLRRNNLRDRIEIVNADIETVSLPSRVDLLVSEWLGVFGVDENLLTPLLVARDRWLKPGGRILPGSVTAWLAPIWSAELDEEMGFWRRRPYGVDLDLIAEARAHELGWAGHPVEKEDLAAEPQAMWTTDVYTHTAANSRLPFRASLRFEARGGRKVNALTAWFSADFGGGIMLTNEPGAAPTHWGNYVFPLDRAVKVPAGGPITVEFACLPYASGYSHHAWSVRIGDGPWEHHDTRRVMWHER